MNGGCSETANLQLICDTLFSCPDGNVLVFHAVYVINILSTPSIEISSVLFDNLDTQKKRLTHIQNYERRMRVK